MIIIRHYNLHNLDKKNLGWAKESKKTLWRQVQ